ncbi:hypothetical protein MTR_6g011260 [Medicago truncatula]|uniref:Uncharacterized protein n=1 Tax=Medicago truncatula TaxID=3880 RepID=A0A072UGP8_MEDTR|nr:hypothetical protein MTR_6g011260 [Medicago truncatula]
MDRRRMKDRSALMTIFSKQRHLEINNLHLPISEMTMKPDDVSSMIHMSIFAFPEDSHDGGIVGRLPK